MEKSTMLRYMLIFGLCAEYLSAALYDDNSVCTKFSCEERLLEKMIRTESKVEQFEKDVRLLEERVSSVLAYRKEQTELFYDGVTKTLEQQNASLLQFTEHYDKRLQHVIETGIDPANSELFLKHIAFSAFTTIAERLEAGQVIKMPNVILNEGACYNKNTGTFTAPVKGLYYFTAHMCSAMGKYMVFAIFHEDSPVAISTQYEDSGSVCGSTSALILVDAFQTVYLKCAYSPSSLSADVQYRRPSFMGVLLK